MPITKRKSPVGSINRGIIYGYRSGLEERVGAELKAGGHKVNYETFSVPYTPPLKTRRYTPDFWLENGIVIETKGRFLTADRQKHKIIKKQYPDLDIRFVFSNSKTKISKISKTTYANWCETYGFQFADHSIPKQWLAEKLNVVSLDLIKKFLKKDM